MAYVGQFTDGTAPTDAELNTPLATCVLYKTASQTIASGATVFWTFTTAGQEVTDPLGWHSITTNTSRITVSIAGIYRFNATVKTSGELGTTASSQFRKNGTTVVAREAADQSGAGTEASFSISWTGELAANDYLEFGTTNGSASSRTSTFVGFAAHLLGV